MERSRRERQMSGGRHDVPPPAHFFLPSPTLRDLQSFDGKVRKHDLTATLLREIQTRPSAAGPDIEQSPAGCKLQAVAKKIGLGNRGKAAGSPSCADDLALYVFDDVRQRTCVALRELSLRFALVFAGSYLYTLLSRASS
jgi:hypothetical protein